AAIAGTSQRRSAEVVEPDRDTHMGIGGANPIRDVERHPAELGHVGFGPGVAGVLLADVVTVAEVAGDAAGRNAEAARRGDEDMRQVPTGAALARKGLRSPGRQLV